jgi:hypothetical protein
MEGSWQPMATEMGALGSSSSSDAETTPYDGYHRLGDEAGGDNGVVAKEQEQPDEDEAEEQVAWPAPTMALSSKFLPRGTPTSTLAEPLAVDEGQGNGASFSSRFSEIDFAEVARVAKNIKLGAPPKR